MKARTEELLYLLLWSCEALARPRMRFVGESFEGWAYRHGLMRRLAELERRQLVECQARSPNCERMVRLTDEGRRHALGGRDPEEHWSRSWDGKWRLVLFDVPVGKNALRAKVRYRLRTEGFGHLQNSVWITPHPLTSEQKILQDADRDVQSLILLEARPIAGETPSEIVAGAWDFDRINRLYARHQTVLEELPKAANQKSADGLRRWASEERKAWLNAVAIDPLLPQILQPPDYRGPETWRLRIATLQRAATFLEGFRI